MKAPRKLNKRSPMYKHLSVIAVLLLAVALGLFVAWVQPGAVLALMIGLVVVALVLLGESFYLLQVERMKEYNRKNRKRPMQKKEGAAQ